METIQSEHTNNIDSNINSQHSNNEEEKCEAKHKNCFLNKDKCNDDLNDSKHNHLDSKISFLSSSSPGTRAATKEADETLDILNTFDTGTSTFEKDLCNLNETEQKETVSDLTQVDKCLVRLFHDIFSFSNNNNNLKSFLIRTCYFLIIIIFDITYVY